MAAFNAPAAYISLDKTAFPAGADLREGGFVFVRVLASLPEGRTLVSFAGRQFEASSACRFEPGTSFKAQIRFEGGKVVLVPRGGINAPETLRAVGPADFLQPQNAALFASLNLAAEPLVFRLLQQLRQGGMKISAEHILKAKKSARSFAGKEEKAAEAALYMEEKGLDAGEAAIASLLGFFDGSPDGRSGQSDEAGTETDLPEDVFLSKLYENTHAAQKNGAGLLALCNHLAGGKKHWIALPFEYGQGSSFCSGTIRLLCDTELRRTEKIAVTVRLPQKTFYFFIGSLFEINLSSATSKNTEMPVYYSCEPAADRKQRDEYEVFLKELFGKENCVITYSEGLPGCFFFTPDEPLVTVDAEV